MGGLYAAPPINEVANAPDLLDRSLTITLAPINGSTRKTEEELAEAWDEQSPLIFGALLDALSGAIRNREAAAKLLKGRQVRMADAAIYMVAAAIHLGYDVEPFITRLTQDMERVRAETALNTVFGEAVQALMDNKAEWRGTPSQLYNVLSIQAQDRNYDSKTIERMMPKPNKISARLQELTGSLAAVGISWHQTNKIHGTRFLELSRVSLGGDTGGDGGDTQKVSPPLERPYINNGGDRGDGGDTSQTFQQKDINDNRVSPEAPPAETHSHLQPPCWKTREVSPPPPLSPPAAHSKGFVGGSTLEVSPPTDKSISPNPEVRQIEWVRYEGQVYLVSKQQDGKVWLRESGGQKVVHAAIPLSRLEKVDYKE